jgi:hypothetical protein
MLRKLPIKLADMGAVLDQYQQYKDTPHGFALNTRTGSFFGDPWITKPELKNTPLGDVLASIEGHLGPIGEARFLKLPSEASYSAHYDPDHRVHLAITTNPYSFLGDLEALKLTHIPADGQLWYMDTTKLHIASNWGSQERVHLNVRMLIPNYIPTLPGLRIVIGNGGYDWKFVAFTELLCIISKGLMDGSVSGFETERYSDQKMMLVNCSDPKLFDDAMDRIRKAGVEVMAYQV